MCGTVFQPASSFFCELACFLIVTAVLSEKKPSEAMKNAARQWESRFLIAKTFQRIVETVNYNEKTIFSMPFGFRRIEKTIFTLCFETCAFLRLRASSMALSCIRNYRISQKEDRSCFQTCPAGSDASSGRDRGHRARLRGR